MKGQKHCYSARSEVTITVIKQFESSFSHQLPLQAQTSSSAVGQPGGKKTGTGHHSAGLGSGSFPQRPPSGREGAVLQQCTAISHRGTELSCLWPNLTCAKLLQLLPFPLHGTADLVKLVSTFGWEIKLRLPCTPLGQGTEAWTALCSMKYLEIYVSYCWVHSGSCMPCTALQNIWKYL